MALTDDDELKRRFLQQLFSETDGDSGKQVSMYDIGTTLGLERADASKIAEDLIASDLVEIRTLSGAIGIHTEAVAAVRELLGVDAPASDRIVRLGTEPVLSETGKQLIDSLADDVKAQVGSLGLEFDLLSEIMADLKTIDTQLESPRPKTAIVRECLRSISENLAQAKDSGLCERINVALEV